MHFDIVFDAVAAKRSIKTGYVRQPGGLYPTQCDTVAAHSHAVSLLAMTIAHEVKDDLEKMGIHLNLERVATMAIFHDQGETRSGDTGATSHAVYGVCKLYTFEMEGLEATLKGYKVSPLAMELFDEYRKYSSPESLVVHIADNLEGFEKALHSMGNSRMIREDTIRVARENMEFYERRESQLKEVADFLVAKVLRPGFQYIAEAYGAEVP